MTTLSPSKEVLNAAYILYLYGWTRSEWEAPDDFDDAFLDRLKEKWELYWIPSLNEEHCGDCTKVAMPCTRCHMEEYVKTAQRLLRLASSDTL